MSLKYKFQIYTLKILFNKNYNKAKPVFFSEDWFDILI